METPEEKPRPPKAEDPAPRDDVVVGQNRCPFCRDGVRAATTDWVACAACLARHHEPCWGEGGGRCAACGHGERLRADRPAARQGSTTARLVIVVVAALGALVAVGAVQWIRYRSSMAAFAAESAAAKEQQAQREALELARLEAREREREALEAARREASVAGTVERPLDGDARFTIARRVDELRRLNRSGARADARRGRRQAAWKQARVDLALAQSGAAPDEAARLEAARKGIDRLDPPRSGDDDPMESILEEQNEYLMPPRAEHAEFAPFTENMRGRAHAPGYTAHLLVVTGDAKGALAEANRGLDQDATDWLAWLARGEALLALGDPRGATMALTVSEGFSVGDPTWALLARVDLARARGDRKAELAAAYDALEVGQVPEWGGHLQALLERIATLEHELGERR